MGKGTWGCCKLCYARGTQTLIITSSAGNGADEYPCWPQNRQTHFGELLLKSARTQYFIAGNEKRIGVLRAALVPSVITSQTRKKSRGFNLGRSVSHGWSGPCACQRLGEGSVNHGTQPASPGLQLWLFEHSATWNTVGVREKVNGIVRRPCEDTEQVLFSWQI